MTPQERLEALLRIMVLQNHYIQEYLGIVVRNTLPAERDLAEIQMIEAHVKESLESNRRVVLSTLERVNAAAQKDRQTEQTAEEKAAEEEFLSRVKAKA